MFSRKQRRANLDLPSGDGPSNSRSRTTSSRSLFSLSKTFSKTSISSVDDSVDDPKGPLGLTLLSSPSEPQIDFIFVHGLGGGSRKTWSKTQLRSHYWPQEWLGKDPAFKGVRMHSYGYDSDYLKGKENCLNIHHIGKSFLSTISTSPALLDSRTTIVAIGHSMGGLVIKKAYILAKQDAAFKDLAGRFAAIYFLATPHRGADSAKTLKNLLRVAYDRTYVADLERNSGAIQVINDEFRHYSTGLELWSFYETQNMRMFSSPIVDPESAILGYREEKQVPMNADHRSICKFETPSDPNYIILRNSLASTVSNMAVEVPELKLKEKGDRIKQLRKYLEVPVILDDDFLSVRGARMQESCQWILTKSSYTEWRDGEPTDDRTLWIKGKPATGKSVLAGYVIDHLRDSGQVSSYFFFKHGDRSKSRLSHCLRSLAFQMASSNAEASDAILGMQADGIQLDHFDDRTFWRLIFLSGIFPVTMTRHYWIIDALDECSDPTVLFDCILSNTDKSVPLKVLITSRDTADLGQGFSGIPSRPVQSLSISPADTLPDLRLLTSRISEGLRVVEPEHRASLEEKILDKSRGSFLWTILVLKELTRYHSQKEIDQVLEDVPRGMGSLYKRTLDSMSAATRGKKLAKAILTWATCAVRPMTTSELNDALSLEIDDTFPKFEDTIAALCGQLVLVDKYGKVQMVHETAREFLLGEGLDSEFSIDISKAHTRMAQICLLYLVGEEMKLPRTNRRRSLANILTRRLDFAVYAYTAFSYHLSRADPVAAEPFQLLEQFLRSNVLTWIEAIADSRNLNQLIRASKHLKTYVNACAVERSPLDPKIQRMRQWTTDLVRISAKFAKALTVSPSAIYSLIPPFCPTGSMIYTSSGPARRLTVNGALSEQWDDRLMCIDFRQGQPSALCYGEEFLAVGLTSRNVALYYAASHQEYKVMDHGESVRFISFKPKSHLMATCGMKMVKVWDIRSGEAVCSLKSPPRPLGIEFIGDLLLVASHKNYIASWDTGQNASPEMSQRPWSDKPETNHMGPRQPPCALSLSASHGMLAVAYSSQPITLWDLKEDAYFGSCGKKLSSGETSTHIVVSLAFNPNPNIGLLAIAYLDGDLALLDPFADQQLECFRANCQTLAPSPNGRLLAAGGQNGIIHIYEFDTFKLLYRVKSSNSYIKQLGFARDNLRLADIRGAQCTVWEPEALLRDSLSDDSSGTTSSSTSMVETVTVDAKAKITAMVLYPTADVLFCGKDDGTVVLYNSKTARPLRTICRHKSPVRLLVWCERKSALLSVDAFNRILLHGIQMSASKNPSADVTVLFESRLESEKTIVDVLVGEAMSKYLLSTRESDHILDLESGEHEIERTYPDMPGTRKWLQCPQSSQHLVCLCDVSARVYCWADWSEIRCFPFSLNTGTVQLKNATFYSLGQEQRIMLELLDRNSLISSRSIEIFDAGCLTPQNHHGHSLENQSNTATTASPSATDNDRQNTTASLCPAFSLGLQPVTFASSVAHVIGINKLGRFVFIDHSSWVCSVDLSNDVLKVEQGEGLSIIEIVRHFFVPFDWFAGARDVVCTLAINDIMLTRGGDLVIIRGAFDYAEKVSL